MSSESQMSGEMSSESKKRVMRGAKDKFSKID